MLLSKEQMIRGKSFAVLSLFISDIKNGDYSILQKMYECAGIQNSDLIPMIYANRMLATSFEQQIYIDIAYIVKDRIISSEELSAVFIEYYKQRFPDVYDVYQKITQLYIQNRYSKQKFSKAIDHGIGFYKYLIYNSTILGEVDDFIFSIDYIQDDKKYAEYFESTEKDFENRQIHDFTFHETTEKITSSGLFKKNIRRRRKELAEYLNVSEDELAKTIFDNISFSSWKDGDDWHVGEAGKIDFITRQLLMNNICSHSWLREIFTNYKRLCKFNEILNIDMIIEDYYTSLFVEKYLECLKSRIPFQKMTLSRECKESRIEDDYRSILFACEMDILIIMQKMIAEEYYLNFSWERLTKNGYIERYEVITNDLKKDIYNLRVANSLLLEENSVLKTKQVTTDDGEIRVYSKEIDRLIKKCNGQLSEIEVLKDKLSIYEEFDRCNAVNTFYEKTTEIVDIDLLYTKRYLFVGNIKEVLPSLYKKFPNSLFMDTDRFSLTDIKVDAIVMCVERMSHSMYYKVKKSSVYKIVPSIMCNSLNETQILQKVFRTLKDEGVIL